MADEQVSSEPGRGFISVFFLTGMAFIFKTEHPADGPDTN